MESERTLQMKQQFVDLRNSGLTPVEIARKFGVSNRTMYFYLDEIAEKAGVTRDSLLAIPQRRNHRYEFEAPQINLVHINVAEDLSHFETVLTELASVRQSISNYVNTQETIDAELRKGI